MLDFVVTNHWWQKYESGEKNIEYRRKTPYWDKRVNNALNDFRTRKYLPAIVRHGYTSEKRECKIRTIVIKNGKDTDLAIDDWVYCFCFEPERKRKQC